LSVLEAARRLGPALVIDEPVVGQSANLRIALTSIGRKMKVMDA
jgi:hypothetical protein